MRDLGQKKKKRKTARQSSCKRVLQAKMARNQRQCDVVSKGMRSRKLRFRDKEEASGK